MPLKRSKGKYLRADKYRRTGAVTKKSIFQAISARAEDKRKIDTLTSSFSSISGLTWTNYNLMNVAVGNGVSDRIGRRVLVKSLFIYGVYEGGQAGTTFDDANNCIRIIIGLYNSASPLSIVNTSINVPLAKDLSDDGHTIIKKYYDKYHPIDVNAVMHSTVTGSDYMYASQKVFRYYKAFKKPLLLTYTSTGDCDKYLILSMTSDSTIVPHPGFTNGYIVCRYEDS